MDEDYSKDNRRNARNQAKAEHFKNGKSQVRRHKDKVIESNERNPTYEAEVSHLGSKNRSTLAKETIKLLDELDADETEYKDEYIKNTKLFSEDNEIKLSEDLKQIHEDGPDIEFPIQSIISFINDIDENDLDKWVILNYANPTKPGGNFEKDASVYEEALSISSGLYYSLSKGKGKSMYEKNKKLEEKDETDDGVYRGDLIYSPDVPFFRDEDFDLIEDWKNEYRNISIISIPAVNYSKFSTTDEFSKDDYKTIMQERINRIYRVALKHGHTKIVLGPWGCGLEKGPLKEVIKWFSEDDLSDLFDEIYFLCDDEETSKIMQSTFF
jgi:uncharacterized protein (TIGR02452 family)